MSFIILEVVVAVEIEIVNVAVVETTDVVVPVPGIDDHDRGLGHQGIADRDHVPDTIGADHVQGVGIEDLGVAVLVIPDLGHGVADLEAGVAGIGPGAEVVEVEDLDQGRDLGLRGNSRF